MYLEYTGSFYEMIADLDFVDDTDTLSEKDRFKKHYRFLKSLQDDSLLIIDNFNTLQAEDSLLQQICSLKCMPYASYPAPQRITMTSLMATTTSLYTRIVKIIKLNILKVHFFHVIFNILPG